VEVGSNLHFEVGAVLLLWLTAPCIHFFRALWMAKMRTKLEFSFGCIYSGQW
jgi:hypothetical protein